MNSASLDTAACYQFNVFSVIFGGCPPTRHATRLLSLPLAD